VVPTNIDFRYTFSLHEGIAAKIAHLGLDPARIWVGIGSGQPPPIKIVQQAVIEL
jgi:hypothetical protein